MNNLKLKTIIGLEIHIQLKTKSKMFCGCENSLEDRAPNITVCPICMGHPGTLPVVNEQAVEWIILSGLALDGKIAGFTKFDRKNYFYPDLPKGYQISQYDIPFVKDAFLEIDTPSGAKTVKIQRIHLEEDAAKSLHSEKGHTLIDFNRAGTPLLEIVTEPMIESPSEAKLFLQELRLLARYLGISDAEMEKGQLRCDANISLKPSEDITIGDKTFSADKFYSKTEIKNLNSFKAVERALEYEIERQAEMWENGAPPNYDSTRGWDENKEITIEQRNKEEAHDYRYFPEPDLPPFKIEREWVEIIKRKLPELPRAKRQRFMEQYGLNIGDAKSLTDSPALANYLEEVVSELQEWLLSLEETEGTEKEIWEENKDKAVKMAANWLINRLLKLLIDGNVAMKDLKILPENFAEFITLIYQNKINSRAAQAVLAKMFKTGVDPSHVIEEEGLGQMSDENELEQIVEKVMKNNPGPAADYKKGKTNVIMFLLGQVMSATKGKANPAVAKEMLRKNLS